MSLLPILEVAARAGIDGAYLEPRGPHIAKISLDALNRSRPRGKLILVTAINPTRHGEGKTVLTIGLSQALNRLGHRAIATLRQPSLGPVFGLKGGATGGGLSRVEPSASINLHFTGDFHAVTSAHNLLAAMLDAHMFHGGEPELDPARMFWPRAVDMNDRALRRIQVGEGATRRDTGFVITAASEVMAILALAANRQDLRRRLDEIVVGLSRDGGAVRACDLRAAGAMAVLLNEAILPNLVQTGENTPAIIHAGPFGNVAHGTSSVLAQRIALQEADYVVNEAGFGSDLGAEKYFDIVMPTSGLTPSAAVLVVSSRALALQGFENLQQHIANLRRVGVPFVVAINRFASDTNEQISAIGGLCQANDLPCAVADVFSRGGEGGVELAELVIEAADRASTPRPLYSPELPLAAKIELIAKQVYGAAAIVVEPEAAAMLDRFTVLGYGHLPVCMAKTQYSLSDDAKRTGAPRDWTLRVTGANLAAGAGFVVAVAGGMMLMPGLGKDPQAAHMDVDAAGHIVGLG